MQLHFVEVSNEHGVAPNLTDIASYSKTSALAVNIALKKMSN